MALPRLKADHVRGALPVLAIFGGWALASHFGWVSPIVVPAPRQVLADFADPEALVELASGLGASFARLAEGAVIGSSAGVAFGVLLGASPTADRLVGPSFNAFRQISLFAWIPLLTAWLGGGDAAKVVFIAMAAFKPSAMGAWDGVRDTPAAYLEVGRVLCFPRLRALRRIILPAATPSIVAGLQLALISSWLGSIGAEYLLGGIAAGVGSFVIAARERMQGDQVFMGIIAIAAVGAVLNTGVRWAGARATAWKV